MLLLLKLSLELLGWPGRLGVPIFVAIFVTPVLPRPQGRMILRWRASATLLLRGGWWVLLVWGYCVAGRWLDHCGGWRGESFSNEGCCWPLKRIWWCCINLFCFYHDLDERRCIILGLIFKEKPLCNLGRLCVSRQVKVDLPDLNLLVLSICGLSLIYLQKRLQRYSE